VVVMRTVTMLWIICMVFKVVVMRTVTMLWIISMDIVNNSDE